MKSRQWNRGGLLLAALLFAASAFAQGEPDPRRTEIGEPLIPDLTGGPPAWSYVNISGQLPLSTLGSLAVDPVGVLYVWSSRRVYDLKLGVESPLADLPSPRRTEPGEPPWTGGIGGPLPGITPETGVGGYPTPRLEESGDVPMDEGVGVEPMLPVPMVTNSTLYRWDGAVWTPSLELSGEAGATVFIARSGDIYAATDLPDGSIRVYRHHAGTWRQERVPDGVRGPAGAMAGENIVYFRTGSDILRHTGNHWKVEMSCEHLGETGGLVSLGHNQLLVPCLRGEHVLNGNEWVLTGQATPRHVHGAWGGRDNQGALHLFAGGCDPAHCGMRVFEFVESDPGRLIGDLQLTMQDPAPGVENRGSYANRVWGSQVHDVYVTGVVHGVGHLYRFDGQRWMNVAPYRDLPPAVDVGGTAWGELWVSLKDGRLLHRMGGIRPTPAPAAGPGPIGSMGDAARVALGPSEGFVVRSDPGGHATLVFALPDERMVSLAVFDLAGRRVETLERNRLPAGVHQLSWDATRVPSGVYFCRLDAGSLQATRKVLIHR